MRFGIVLFIFISGHALFAESDFQKDVAPLIAEKCLECHNTRQHEGGLDFSTKQTALTGGDSGKVFVPGQLEESLLWERVSADEMPPKHPLSPAEKGLLKLWIQQGAHWTLDRIDPFAYSTSKRGGYDWWSLQPLRKPVPPKSTEGQHPIDAFIQAKLVETNLTPSPRAKRRTLIRRLSFDLIGLPPAYEEVQAFEADKSTEAYSALVDRLLASPHYGERWARHWLDLARFGESQGFERDKLRENSWPYRDWVIQALNADMPYDQFARMQIAGDVLEPSSADGIVATGFLVAGPYDEVGQAQQSAAMRAIVRQDEMEDYIGTLCQTFLGLTANCARCHDHKFDPISQTEYYQIAAALAGIRAGERPYETQESKEQLAKSEEQLKQQTTEINALLAPTRELILQERKTAGVPENLPQPIAMWSFDNDTQDQIGNHHGQLHGGARIDGGQLILNGQDAYLSTTPLQENLQAKTLEAWVQLDNLTQRGGGLLSVQTTDGVLFDAIVYGEKEPQHWMAGSNGFVRWQSFQATPEATANQSLVHVAIVYNENGTIQAYRNGAPYGKPYKANETVTFPANQSQVLIGLRHGTSAGGNRLLAGRIEQAHLYNRALTAEEINSTSQRFDILTTAQIIARLSAQQKALYEQKQAVVDRLKQEIQSLRNRRVYAVVPREPEATHVLLRGNPATPAEQVTAAGIASIQGLSGQFNLPVDASDADRRRMFAAWVTSESNPLFARVIANRVWHYHFGSGIVASCNDFGFNGSRPTHPELLDYLANYLKENDWSLKKLHRLIVTSQTYQQSSQSRPDGLQVDAGNQWLWRYAPQRLEAEVVRDTMLKVSDRLNPKMGGPSYRNFETFNRNSQFYIMQDREEPEFHRRTIYRMWVRSGRNRLLDALDCPDPSVTTPNRAVTITPTQSLSLLNNPFVLRMAAETANRVSAEVLDSPNRQVGSTYQALLQRNPTQQENSLGVEFIQQHGLTAFVRVLFNTNEFLFAQ